MLMPPVRVATMVSACKPRSSVWSVFVFVGMTPRTDLIKDVVPLAKGGYVETSEAMETNVPGLYVAGDARVKRFRQITTAVADGTIAALAAQRYVKEHRS